MRVVHERRFASFPFCTPDHPALRHTIFGRVAGSTFFNAQRIGEVDVDKDDRPLEPPRVLRIDIVDNPVPGLDIAAM